MDIDIHKPIRVVITYWITFWPIFGIDMIVQGIHQLVALSPSIRWVASSISFEPLDGMLCCMAGWLAAYKSCPT